MIIRDGVITYYRDKPAILNFKNLDEGIGKPKGQISARHCMFKKVTGNIFINKKHKHLFEISFISPQKNKKKRIFWVFSVPNSDLLETWITFLEEAKKIDSSIEEESEIQKKIEEEQTNKLKLKALNDETIRKAAELERRRNKQKEKLLEEENRKIEIEKEIKRLQLESEEKKNQEALKKRREKYQKLLENSWDYNFQKLWSKSLEQTKDFEDNLKCGLELFKHAGVFISQAKQATKNIINELLVASEYRNIHEIEKGDITSYVYQNMLIRITAKSDAHKYWKSLGHEFRGNNTLFDVLYFTARTHQTTFNFRVPLMCIVDYKGFRSLVMALAPLESERTLIHGPKSDGVYILNTGIYTSLALISNQLNVKQHIFEWNPQIGPVFVHLSAFTEFHKSLGYTKLEEYVQETMGKDIPEHNSLGNHVYVLKLANIFPLDYALNLFEDQEDSLDFTQRLRPEFIQAYGTKLSPDSFLNLYKPSSEDDLELINACKYLRGDWINKLVHEIDNLITIPLDSQSLTDLFHSFGVNMRYLGLVAEKSTLSHVKSMIYVEIIARTCKNIFFQDLSEYIFKMFEENQESSPRKIEKRVSIAHLSISQGLYGSIGKNSGNFYGDRARSSTKSIISPLKIPRITHESKSEDYIAFVPNMYQENAIEECIIDFYNLVFGNHEESSYFWESILIPYSYPRFNLQPGRLKKNEINLHGLLHSINYHFSVSISFDSQINLGRVPEPFSVVDFQSISEKSKVYKMCTLECKTLSDQTKHYKSINKHSLALQACDLKLKINKAVSGDETLGDPAVLTELAEIMIETGDIEGAILHAKESLTQTHPLDAKSVNNWIVLLKALHIKGLYEEASQCFHNAIVAVQFHWGEFHPLVSTVHSALAKIYTEQEKYSEALSLYKNALLCCLKALGPNHVRTAEVYLELCSYYLSAKNLENAFEVAEKAFCVYQACYGKDSIVTAEVGVKLSEILLDLGRYDQAVDLIHDSCRAYEAHISTHALDNDFQSYTTLKKYHLAAYIGLTIALKTNNYPYILLYAAKLWETLDSFSDFNEKLPLTLLKHTVEAKLNSISSKQKFHILNILYVKHKPSQETVLTVQKNFNTRRFISIVKNNGGLGSYVQNLVEKVYVLGCRTESMDASDKSVFKSAVIDLSAILDYVSAD
jgi:tetratricopeptide (TPR) repeat protein